MYTRLLTTFRTLSTAILLAFTALSMANAQERRISAQIEEGVRTTLAGPLLPMAQPQLESGRMSGEARLTGMSLVFTLSDAQQADLKELLAAQQNPASSQYHQWLTPEEFGARFGVSEPDLAAIEGWLRQQGFAVGALTRGRTALSFSGTVSQVEAAFATELHTYAVDGVERFAPSTALSLPTALSAVVGGVQNLDSFPRFKPLHGAAQLSPAYTNSSGSSVYLAPGDIDVIYDVTPLRTAGLTGAGQTITIVGKSAVDATSITNFQAAAGVTQKLPTMILVPNTGSAAKVSGDESESELDIEWASAMAPGASINFVYAGSNSNASIFDAITYAVNQKLGTIISISYAGCETINASKLSTYDLSFQQAAAQGQSVVAASGDQGSTSCFSWASQSASYKTLVDVMYPASSSYVTAVGGTEIDKSNSAYRTPGSGYWLSSNTTVSGRTASAVQYVPEVVWNDTTSTSTSPDAAGGGVSKYFSKPSYQAALSSASMRALPDVSLFSSASDPGYLICTGDTSVTTSSCTNGFLNSSGSVTRMGGTSFATPVFAGMLALLNEKHNYTSGLGLANTTLYKLASTDNSVSSGSYTAARGYHDITSGSNTCAYATLCGSNAGASAATGFDTATGLGSVDLATLAGYWPDSGSTKASTTTTITAPSSTIYAGTAYTYTITVAPASGSATPTGTVTLAVDGSSTTSTVTLASGAASFSTTFSASGAHQIVANYSGDSSFAASSATLSVTATTASKASTTTTITAPSSTIYAGTAYAYAIKVTPASGSSTPTGTVTLAVDGSSTTSTVTLASGAASFSTTFSTSGTHQIVASYSGDSSFAASATTLSVTAAATPLTLVSNVGNSPTTALTVSQGSSGAATLTLTSTSSSALTVSFQLTAANTATSTAWSGIGCYKISNVTIPAGGSATAALTLYTSSSQCSSGSAIAVHQTSAPKPAGGARPLGALALAGALLLGLGGRRRRLLQALCATLLLAAAGCGGGNNASSSGSTSTSVAKGSYAFTLSAADASSSSTLNTTPFYVTVY